jgi:nucleoid DNA-binding protein
MKKIENHIEELLHDHDCVIVPEFGGFITSKKPAYFNQFTSVFFPATKRILFNKHLVYNDGLLSAKIAEKQSLSMAEAQQLLIQFKDDCFLRLNEEGRVEIERVGVLFFDKEKNIQFQQASTNFLKDSYGLKSLGLQKVAPLPTKEKEEKQVKLIARVEEPKESVLVKTPVQERTKKRTSKRYGQLVPLLMLPILAVGVYIGVNKNTQYQHINIADVNPFHPVVVNEYSPRSGESFELDWQLAENKTIESPKEQPKLEEILPKVDSTFSKPVDYISEKRYHVIAGCFSVKENADNLVKEWSEKGNESLIVDKKGSLYRVAIQSFVTREEANEFLTQTKNESKEISLWILKK